MWYKMSWGLSVLAVVLLIGFSMLIIPTQMELKQMREEAKATEKRLQEEGKMTMFMLIMEHTLEFRI